MKSEEIESKNSKFYERDNLEGGEIRSPVSAIIWTVVSSAELSSPVSQWICGLLKSVNDDDDDNDNCNFYIIT